MSKKIYVAMLSFALSACGGSNAPQIDATKPAVRKMSGSLGVPTVPALNLITLPGNSADYVIARNAGAATYTISPKDASSTMQWTVDEPGLVRFDDTSIALDLDGKAAAAYRLYQAAFDRAPDGSGLSYWIQALERGMDLKTVASYFVVSDEFKQLYGAEPSNAKLVNAFYRNVLHRDPEQGGFNYWLDLLNRKWVTPTELLIFFSEGSENKAALAVTLEKGIAYAETGIAYKNKPQKPGKPAPNAKLTISPALIAPGEAATLSWTSEATTACSATGTWSGTQLTSGATTIMQFTPGTYTYGLTCNGADGVANAEATLTVKAQPAKPVVTIYASSVNVAPGRNVTVTWNATNASTCNATGSWSGARAASGTVTYTLNQVGTYLFSLNCSGQGGEGAGQVSVVADAASQPAPTVSVAASPSTVVQGKPTTITWSSTNASACSATGAWSGNLATSGSQSPPAPTTAGTATYGVTCTGAGGTASGQASVTVTAAGAAPVINLAVSSAKVTVGQSVNVIWSVANASACNASGAWSGSRGTSGNMPFVPAAPGTYRFGLTCSGQGGTQDGQVTVVAEAAATPAPTVSVTANTASVVLGKAPTISWRSTNATSCAATGAWSGSLVTNGSAVAPVPSATGKYTYGVTCTGSGGMASSQADVTVTAPPSAPVVSLSPSTASVAVGGSVTLSWLATNATSCVAAGDWSGSLATSGTQALKLSSAGSKKFDLACTGPGGTRTASTAVDVLSANYMIGGTVTGYIARGYSVLLRINDQSEIAVSTKNFTFPGTYPSGFVYEVSIARQPLGWSQCTLNNFKNTVRTRDVSSISVNCTSTVGGDRGVLGKPMPPNALED